MKNQVKIDEALNLQALLCCCTFFDNAADNKKKFFLTLSRSIAKKNPHTLTLSHSVFCVSSFHWMNLLLSNFYITYINIHFYDDIPLSLNEIKSFILNFFSSSFSLTLVDDNTRTTTTTTTVCEREREWLRDTSSK